MVPLLDGIGGVLGVNVVSEASGWEGKGEINGNKGGDCAGIEMHMLSREDQRYVLYNRSRATLMTIN